MEEKRGFHGRVMEIRTIGDLKEFLKDVPDERVIGYMDFSGGETVRIWEEKQTGWVNIN